MTIFRTAVTAALFLAASIFVPMEVKADTTVTSTTITWNAGGVYVVNDNVTINDRVVITKAVTLKIADGKTLTVPKGITVSDTGSLTIVGPGKLIAGVSGQIETGNAGIGGANGQEKNGTLTISGGTVVAQGGEKAPGIGSGYGANDGSAGGYAGGTVSITGGTVTATGGTYAAGIGCNIASHLNGPYSYNPNSAHAPNISITGGTVTAKGGSDMSAIVGQYLTSKKTYGVSFSDKMKVTNVTAGETAAAADRVKVVVSTKGAGIKVEEIKPVITFNLDGGNFAKTSFTVGYNTYWSTYSIKEDVGAGADPTKTGYTFNGWTKADGSKFSGEYIKEDITLKAGWLKNHTVTFDIGNDASGQPEAQTVPDGKTATPPTSPTKSGYTCVGWLLDGQKYDFSTAVTENITLTAKWDEKTAYNVTFMYRSDKLAEYQVPDGETVKDVVGIVPGSIADKYLKDYETFLYWYDAAGAGTGDDPVKYEFNTPITKTTKIYAFYKELPEVTVSFLTGTESTDTVFTTQKVRAGKTVSKPATDPTRKGYAFRYWADKDGNEYQWSVSVPESAAISGLKLYAVWKYDGNGYAAYNGTVTSDGTMNYNLVYPDVSATALSTENGIASDESSAVLSAVKSGFTDYNNVKLWSALDPSAVNTSKVIGDKGATNVNRVDIYIKSSMTGVHLAKSGNSTVVDRVVYSLSPMAYIEVNYNGTNGGDVAIKNSDLISGAVIPVKLYIPSSFKAGNVNVVHTGSGGFSETYSNLEVQGSGDSRYVTVEVSHFSDFTVTSAGTTNDDQGSGTGTNTGGTTDTGSGTGSGSGSTGLPNTDSMDARGTWAVIFMIAALCAAGAFLVRRRSYRKS